MNYYLLFIYLLNLQFPMLSKSYSYKKIIASKL